MPQLKVTTNELVPAKISIVNLYYLYFLSNLFINLNFILFSGKFNVHIRNNNNIFIKFQVSLHC